MYVITAGVSQGSDLSPLPWNLMYDGVSRLLVAKQAIFVGFADDVGVVIISNHPKEVEIYANETIQMIKSWLKHNGLKLAEHKMELVRDRNRKPLKFASKRILLALSHR